MEYKYKVWADSESKVGLMPHQEQFFETLDEACDVASEYAHEYDKEPYWAIFHVEDLENEETIATFDNFRTE